MNLARIRATFSELISEAYFPRCWYSVGWAYSRCRLVASLSCFLVSCACGWSGVHQAHERAEPAGTAQRLDGVRFEFEVASSAWLTRD